MMSVQMGMESVVTVMVGNKVDLEDKREVPLQTASKVGDITTATSQTAEELQQLQHKSL